MNRSKRLCSLMLCAILIVLSVFVPTTALAAVSIPYPTATSIGINTGYPYGGKHYGIDILASVGTPVYATFDGTAYYRQTYYTASDGKQYLVSYGNSVLLTSSSNSTYSVLYAHLNSFEGVGQTVPSSQTKQLGASDVSGEDTYPMGTRQVRTGDLLGYTGATGNVTGPHLHFEVRLNGAHTNPMNYLDTKTAASSYAGTGYDPISNSVIINPDNNGGGSTGGGTTGGGGSTGGGTTVSGSGYIVHIDHPTGTYSGSNVEISGWIVSDKAITYAMGEVRGVSQYGLELYDADDVNAAYPSYAYRKRFRGVIPADHLSANSSYEFIVWMGLSDGSTTNLTSSSFSVTTLNPSVKDPILHIDSPIGSYSGSNNIEISGWIVSDIDISYAMAQVGDITQYGLSLADDAAVAAAYPSYKYAKRFRGVVEIGILKSNTAYELLAWCGLADGSIHYVSSTFGIGTIIEENTTDYVLHMERPIDYTASGSANFEVAAWVAARAPITYAMFEVRKWTGSGYQCIYQNHMGIEEAADVQAAYSGYPYCRRLRGVIEPGYLDDNSEYIVVVWCGLGAQGVQSRLLEGKFWTKDVEKATYAITYDALVGSGAPATHYKTWHTDTLLSPGIPTLFGHNFLGWTTIKWASVPEYMPGDPYVKDAPLTLYAIWEHAKDIGSTIEKRDIPINPPQYGWTANFRITPSATTEYRFETSGDKDTWINIKGASAALRASDDNSGTNNNAKLKYVMTAGKTYYIEVGINNGNGYYGFHFTRSYPVTFDANGGKGGPTGTYYQYHGEKLTLPKTVPTLTRTVTLDANGGTVSESTLTYDAEFLGWDSTRLLTDETYAAGAAYSANEAAKFYAVWGAPTLGELETPVREGYVFDGWSDGSDEVITADTPVTSDMTLTAQWTVTDVTVSFDSNGGSAVSDVTATYGQPYGELPAPTRTGHDFAGWVDADGNPVTADTVVSIAGAHTLTAQWTARSMTVTFYNNGKTEDVRITVTYGQPYGELPVLTRTGYTFGGWTLWDGEPVTADTVVWIGSSHTLVAVWTPVNVTVSFNSNGGSAVSAVSVTYDQPYGELPAPTRSGYTFAGWTDASGNPVTADTVVSIADAHTLTAQWTKNAVGLTSIKMNPTSATMFARDTVQLSVILTPSDVTDRAVVWASLDETIATVDETGLVTGVSEGMAIITATHTATGKDAVCIVYVNAAKELVLPAMLTEIEAEAFSGNASISVVKAAPGLERINSAAFKACSALTDVWLPNTVSFIASDAFDGCSDSLVFHCVEGSRAYYFAKAYGFETKTDYIAP